jgi:hypothetical protein
MIAIASLSQVLAQNYIIFLASFAGKCLLLGGLGYISVALIDKLITKKRK